LKTFETKRISLQKIFLDNENARHDPIDNEPEITAHLISKFKVKSLAAHIAKTEAINPLERIGVFPHPVVKDAYISDEGNRRMCALKLLNDPDKAPEGHRSFFRKLSESMGSPPSHVDAVIFKDRQEGRPWVQIRHEGPQEGIGTLQWDVRGKVRHNRGAVKPTNPNVQAVALAEYALKRGLLSKPEHDEINVTTVTRYLSNPVFRDTLGLTSRRDLSISVVQKEFDQALEFFLRDSLKGNKGGVSSRSNAKQRAQYGHKLRKDKVAPTTRLANPIRLEPSTGKSTGTGSRGSGRNSHNPNQRAHIIEPPFAAKISNKVLVRIYGELRSLDCRAHPFSGAYLLRAMIEFTFKLWSKENGIATEKVELHNIIDKAVDKLVADGTATEKALKPLRVMSHDKHGLCSPDTLGSFVHGGTIPTGSYLNSSWDSIESCMALVLGQLK